MLFFNSLCFIHPNDLSRLCRPNPTWFVWCLIFETAARNKGLEQFWIHRILFTKLSARCSIYLLFGQSCNHVVENTVREASQTRHGFFQTWEMYHMFGNSPYLEGISSIGWEMHQTLRACIGHLERNAKYSVKCFPKTLRPTSYLERYIKSKNYPQKHSEIYPIPWEIATIYTLRDYIPYFSKDPPHA